MNHNPVLSSRTRSKRFQESVPQQAPNESVCVIPSSFFAHGSFFPIIPPGSYRVSAVARALSALSKHCRMSLIWGRLMASTLSSNFFADWTSIAQSFNFSRSQGVMTIHLLKKLTTMDLDMFHVGVFRLPLFFRGCVNQRFELIEIRSAGNNGLDLLRLKGKKLLHRLRKFVQPPLFLGTVGYLRNFSATHAFCQSWHVQPTPDIKARSVPMCGSRP